MGGWVGGDQKGPLIFLIFKYVKKKDVLIPKMVSFENFGTTMDTGKVCQLMMDLPSMFP